MKILLAEDDIFLSDIYDEILKDKGYEVTLAKDGKETLDKIKIGGWDVVLIDVFMPQLNGTDVLTSIGRDSLKSYTQHIILMTNTDDPQIINEVKDSIDGYILKSSVTPDKFIEKVEQILNS